MIELKWQAFNDADCDAFRIYRSIPGFTLTFPLTLAGTELKIQVTSPDLQVISITLNTAVGVAGEINAAIKGATATVSDSGTQVFVRINATKNPRMVLKSCTFASAAGLAPGVIVPESSWEFITAIPRVNNTFDYDFTDPDGAYSDSYRLTTITGLVESAPSIIKRPVIALPPLCVLEGRILSGDNRPLQNAIVRAKPQIPEDCVDGSLVAHGVTQEQRTDTSGRFSINLLQKHVYLLEIPAIGYNEVVDVPEADWGRIISLPSTSKHWFTPGTGDPI